MPDTVKKYLGLTLLPHSGVSLVFTGIICSTLASSPELVKIVQGTIFIHSNPPIQTKTSDKNWIYSIFATGIYTIFNGIILRSILDGQ